MRGDADDLVAEQIEYYRARAPEYDRMLVSANRYDLDGLDPASPDPSTRELAAVEQRLAAFGPTGHVLELASGSGWWTRRLATTAASVTAVDASPEMLSINQRRVEDPRVQRVQSDIFAWEPARQYDVVFFSFWLSHVPPDRFAEFWALVSRALAPGGRVFFIDESSWDPPDGPEQLLGSRGAAMRRLEDGREFRMVKVYHQPAQLSEDLAALGWEAQVEMMGPRIFCGVASPQA